MALDTIGLRHILDELEHGPTRGTIVYCDNQSALAITRQMATLRNKSKHLDMRTLKVREMQAMGFIETKYCVTREMWADIFTKNLPAPLFTKFRDGITGYTPDLTITQQESQALFVILFHTAS